MWETLIPAVKAILDTLTVAGKPLAVVKDRPLIDGETLEAFPAVVFFPSSGENEFMTNDENRKEYAFKIYVMAECEVAGIETAFNTLLASSVDEVTAKFDEAWDGGTIDGHRVWYRLTDGDWGLSQEQNGLIAVAELNLLVKLATNN